MDISIIRSDKGNYVALIAGVEYFISADGRQMSQVKNPCFQKLKNDFNAPCFFFDMKEVTGHIIVEAYNNKINQVTDQKILNQLFAQEKSIQKVLKKNQEKEAELKLSNKATALAEDSIGPLMIEFANEKWDTVLKKAASLCLQINGWKPIGDYQIMIPTTIHIQNYDTLKDLWDFPMINDEFGVHETFFWKIEETIRDYVYYAFIDEFIQTLIDKKFDISPFHPFNYQSYDLTSFQGMFDFFVADDLLSDMLFDAQMSFVNRVGDVDCQLILQIAEELQNNTSLGQPKGGD